MDALPQLYAHRHHWPHWNDSGTEAAVALLAQAAVEWQEAHLRYATAKGRASRERLRQKILNLGVAAWWSLNQFSDEFFQPEQLDLAGRAETVAASERWQGTAQPLDAWSLIIVRRLGALFLGLATGFSDEQETFAFARRQLLFIACSTEQALDLAALGVKPG